MIQQIFRRTDQARAVTLFGESGKHRPHILSRCHRRGKISRTDLTHLPALRCIGTGAENITAQIGIQRNPFGLKAEFNKALLACNL